VVELLRPPPRSSWRDRLATLAGGVTITRLLTTAGAVLLVAVTAWWLLRTPAPPVERSLPSARSPGAGVAASAGSTPGAPTATTVATSLVATTTATEVVVQAAGAVTVPGVYRVAAGARVVDVVTAAGGPTADADLQAVPLAAKVTDGARVYVPRAGEVVPAGGGSSAGTDGGGAAIGVASGPGPPTPADPLDLNQATELELEALPGVGPATAQAIVDYRTEHGPFAAVDDLLDVRGIGPAKLDAFRDVVRVG
jgi:competence protein ComEA